MIRIVSLGTLRAATASQELDPCSVKMIQGARNVSYFKLFQVAPSQVSTVSTCFEFQSAIRQDGPYFLGKEISMVDIALFPFWQRFLWVGGHYRGHRAGCQMFQSAYC